MQIIFVSARNFFASLKDSKELFLEKLIRLTIYLGIFLVPIFFLPIFIGFAEYLRLIVFAVLIILGLILWLLKVWLEQRINLNYKFLDLSIVIFVLVYFLASLLAIDRYQGFIGSGYFKAGSLVSILLLAISYFLVSRFINTLKRIRLCLALLNCSIFLALIVNVIKIFTSASWLAFFSLPINTFNFLLVLGAVLSLALFLAGKTRLLRYFNLLLAVIFLAFAYLVGEPYLLLVLMLMIFIGILVFSFKSKFFDNKLIVGLTLILFLTAIALIVPISKFTHLVSPREFNLPLSYGWQITKNVLNQNLLLGVGPQNFAYSFYEFKPASLNQTNFWQLGFAKDSNFWLGIANDIGLLGLAVILITLALYFYRSIKFIKGFEITDHISRKFFIVNVAIFLVLAGLLIFGLFYNFDFILIYVIFLCLGLTVSLMQPSGEEKILANKLIINLLVYVSAVLAICFIYFASRFVAADFLAQKALSVNFSSLADFKKAASYIDQSISLNSNDILYRSELLDVLTNEAAFINKNKIETEEDLSGKISAAMNDILASKTKSYAAYASLNQDLEILKNAGISVSEVQKAANQKMLELNPSSPELYIDRALLNFNDYLMAKEGKAQLDEAGKNALLNKVKNDLEKSISLKNDFVLGYYNLGLYYQETGDEAKALANIKKAFDLDPSQQIVALSLKKIYINQDNFNAAEETLKKYLESNPKDASVRLELAAVYKENKQTDLARTELNEVLKIDPNNLTAKQLLSQLK